MSRFSVHYKRPRSTTLHSFTVWAKDALDASRKVKGWAGKGWLEYGITRHAADALIVLDRRERALLLSTHTEN